MSDDEDPEVIRDLQLRAASEHDSTRTRISSAALGTWKPDGIVEHWPCRRPGCAKPVGVTKEAVEHLAMFNGHLRRRREREVATDAVVLCEDCRKLLDETLAERADERNGKIAALVQRMKASPTPRSEHETIRELERLHHPDIRGLLDHLDAKLTKSGKRARGEL